MPTETSELDEFLDFAEELKSSGTIVSLDEAMQRFREQQQAPPRTPVVQRLDELRAQFIAEGGKLLTPQEVEREVRERRGAQFAEETE